MVITVDFILSSLRPFYPLIAGGSARICCPWHDETKPSLYVNLNEDKVPLGTFYCFGCNESGNWNKLADVLGLEQVDLRQTYDKEFTSLYRRLRKLTEKGSYKLPENLTHWDGVWRGFTAEQLTAYRPARFYDMECEEYRILFPIIQERRLMGHLIERLEDGHKGPKHKFSEGFPSQKCLYPLDLLTGNVAILVEGLGDMLRLRKEGLPALCFFGCGNWKATKANLLLNRVTRVIVCGDGDKAGHEINRTIKKDLERYVDVTVFKIPIFEKKIDPGDMPDCYIRSLRCLI